MVKSKFDWAIEAAKLPSDEFVLAMPVRAYLGEAADVVRFYRDHYAADAKSGRPGLASAGAIVKGLDDQIESLAEEVQRAHIAYLTTVDEGHGPKLERARFIVSEIVAAMEFLLDDDVVDDEDAKLGKLLAAHKDDPFVPDALALALEDFAALAAPHRKALAGLGGFDAALLDEAKPLAKELRAIAEPPTAAAAKSRLALGQRNRLLHLLDARIRKVRSAARFVFRNHPEIARKAASAYEAERRAAARRAAKRKAAAPPEPAESA